MGISSLLEKGTQETVTLPVPSTTAQGSGVKKQSSKKKKCPIAAGTCYVEARIVFIYLWKNKENGAKN